MRLWTGLVGSVVEAWAELRIHRTRVLLSLIGVAVAVAALTGIMALGAIAEQSQVETMERQAGRPATLQISVYNPMTGESVDAAELDAAFSAAMERYDIRWHSRNAYTSLLVQFPDGVRDVQTQVVDPEFGVMHRVQLAEGEWFTAADAERLAPAVIVNENLWNLLGAPDLRTHPTVLLPGTPRVTAVITAVTPSPDWDEYPSMLLLTSAWDRIATPELAAQLYPNYEAWVPLELADELTSRIQVDIAGALGTDWQTDVMRSDYLAYSDGDPLLFLKLLVTGVAVLILLLGALGLVNISLVTVRHRIREIGIRRSFGATAGRVFFAVMMESVVATVVAGVVGVALAVLIVKNPWVTEFVSQGIDDVPAFPLDAALIGLASATGVGALAGLLPALVAVRVKVIDAIRY
ncbi:MAG: FtsX-like permease family protein [Schumannella sp.]|nr:ABC transporter permease [Microbacteriaceae bacterium]